MTAGIEWEPMRPDNLPRAGALVLLAFRSAAVAYRDSDHNAFSTQIAPYAVGVLLTSRDGFGAEVPMAFETFGARSVERKDGQPLGSKIVQPSAGQVPFAAIAAWAVLPPRAYVTPRQTTPAKEDDDVL